MSNESQLNRVKQFMAAASGQDRTTLLELIDDSFEWIIPAPSLGLAPNRGEAAVDALLSVLGGNFVPGSIKMEVVRSAVDGDSVVLEVYFTATTTAGEQYDNWYVNWFKLKDNLITLWREHSDTKQAVDKLSG